MSDDDDVKLLVKPPPEYVWKHYAEIETTEPGERRACCIILILVVCLFASIFALVVTSVHRKQHERQEMWCEQQRNITGLASPPGC